MTEAHIERIRSNCVNAQTTLGRLHTSDALLRVNRGRLYESIATKLMASLNSRIVANQLDNRTLVDIYTTYEQRLTEFRVNYQTYEQSMSETLRINCENQPVSFYDKVKATSDLRKKVHASVVSLHQSINDYKVGFEAFAKKFEENGS